MAEFPGSPGSLANSSGRAWASKRHARTQCKPRSRRKQSGLFSLTYALPCAQFDYLRRPPPPLRPPRDPMLDAPRELLARALDPLIPPEPPPKAPPPLDPPPEETLRLPTRSPPPPPRFAPTLFAPPAPRLPAPDCWRPPRSIVPACAPCPLPPNCPWFCRALACRLPMESPRAVPPYLFAVALFEYGAPPRCWELCCQELLPVRLPFLLDMLFFLLELFTNVLLLFFFILLFPPQPLLQHHPPPQAAPTIIPTPKERAMPAA